MPFTLPILPSNLNSLLSSLRAPIFQTQHNPDSLRLGTKYLRRRLRGPSMVTYYPVMPSLRRLNRQHPRNKYANWQGVNDPNTFLPSDPKAVAKRARWASIREERGEETAEGGVRWTAKVLLRKAGGRDDSEEIKSVRGAGVVEDGFEEMERVKGAGWLWDEKEDARVKKVTRRNRIGKGPPKKGEGRKAQMRGKR